MMKIAIMSLIFIVLFIIIPLMIIIYVLIQEYIEERRKNCYRCKYYKLYDIESYGDCCWFKCCKTGRVDRQTKSYSKNYVICEYFKEG